MAHPTTGKRFVALSAAVALGFGGALIAGPASAEPTTDLKAVAAEAFTTSDNIAAIGHGEDGTIVAQVVAEEKDSADVETALEPVSAFAEETTGEELVVQEVASNYSSDPVSAAGNAADAEDYEAHDDVVAGAGYVVFNGDQGGHCSIGFPATDADGNDAIITAGHCSDVGGEVYVERPSTANAFTDTYETAEWDETRKLGTFTHSQYGPDVFEDVNNESDLDPKTMQDFAVITVDESSGFNLIGEAATWSEESGGEDNLAADTTPITGVHDVTTDDIGKEVFHSGRTTGKTSGNIGLDEAYSDMVIGGIVDGYAPVADDAGNDYMVYGFASETPVGGGDSGGTVMLGDKAVGVVSGGIDAEGDLPALLWTAELAEGLTHLPGDYEIKTSEGSDPSPTATETADPTTPAPTPTETEDPVVDAELAVDPQEITAERFVAADEEQADAEDRGVTYTVEGAEPGSEVVFDTFAAGDDEASKSITVAADEDGVASSRIWGLTSADAEAYIGDYDVVATTEDETLEGSFSVVAGEDDGGEGGEDLPRTGSTVGPLAAGAAGLVALGGALVYVARRRQA
ncbi:S1 family peptidase [Brevibacterium yomogidense]|uniref:S1 family peptidase n=1 Tax=Brevibacterium yomogidense TaxID=946573 RepID=UPI0018DF9FC8|nr:S1 family peptidase [Brevibacterium yomogidense]